MENKRKRTVNFTSDEASRKRELIMTGGGRLPLPTPSTGVNRIIDTILAPALEGLENAYDSDALQDINFLNSGNEVVHVIEIKNEPSCSFTQGPLSGTSVDNNDGAMNTNWNKENNLKCEGWTPNALKGPIAEVLQSANAQEKKGNSWLKRTRPDQKSLGDQLVHEKINFVKSLIHNSQEESKRRILILEEQLKQEKIKTHKLLSNNH